VIEGKGLYDQSLAKDKGDERAADVTPTPEMDQPIVQSAIGGV
jgi:hypothetical protein